MQLSRSAQEKQWDMEREQLRRTEAQQHFSSLLVDLVKDPLSSWTESKKQLRKDQRWDLSELIEMAEKEKMFREHVSQLSKKRRLQFRKLLEETSKVRAHVGSCNEALITHLVLIQNVIFTFSNDISNCTLKLDKKYSLLMHWQKHL